MIARSNACFKSGMIDYSIRDYTLGTMDTADDNTSAVEAKMLMTAIADSPVSERVLTLVFKELTSQKSAKKAYKIRQKSKTTTLSLLQLLLQKSLQPQLKHQHLKIPDLLLK